MFKYIRNAILPSVRSLRYGLMLRRAVSDAKNTQATPLTTPVGFIIGCGRSGTTILGKLLSSHEHVHYLREPYFIWRAITPASDMIRFFGDAGIEPRCIMGCEDISNDAVIRFNACMQADLQRSGSASKRVIEKTPINAMRIPMLNRLSPQSSILHLVRNGIDVVRSIDRLARSNTYRLGGKGDWNQWWGREHCKWNALANDAINANWYANEVPLLETNFQMGALEWLVSLGEINAHREELGTRLIEVKYSDLTADPQTQLRRICTHFDIEPETHWLTQSTQQLHSERKNAGEPLELPPKMCEAFNQYQDQYGFEGYAVQI